MWVEKKCHNVSHSEPILGPVSFFTSLKVKRPCLWLADGLMHVPVERGRGEKKDSKSKAAAELLSY